MTIVVAKYKEDESQLAWLNELDDEEIYVYDKSKDIPNIGRESHTYLWHIVKTYDDICRHPEKVTLFTQPHLYDHLKDVYKNPFYKPYELPHPHNNVLYAQALCEEAFHKGISESIAQLHDYIVPFPFLPHYHFRMKEWPLFKNQKTQINKHDWPFGFWFKKRIQHPFPRLQDMKWFLGGIFAVKNERIACKPLSYYQMLLDEFDDRSINPEVGHYFERSWYYVFLRREESRRRTLLL